MKVMKIEDVVVPENKTRALPNKAYSIVKGTDGQWQVISVSYDVATGEVGGLFVERSDIAKGVAVEAFKILVAQSGMLN